MVFSIRHQIKLNWTGPVFLVALPAIANQIFQTQNAVYRPLSWGPVMAALVIIYGGMLHYVTIGIPGVPYLKDMALPVAWAQMGEAVEEIENAVESENGNEPLVVGMDKYFIASGLAFYRHSPVKNVMEGVEHTTSRNLLGKDALMYDYWHFSELQIGRTAIMVSFRPKDLSEDKIAPYFQYLDPLREVALLKHGVEAGRFYYRIGRGYLGDKRYPKRTELPRTANDRLMEDMG
jgi:dolichol-phosphate mannosyltransferase